MLRYISADWIYPVTSPPLKNGVMALDEKGKIQQLFSGEEAKELLPVTRYDGIIVPGFINTHCHLELSHLKHKIAEGTGLTRFIESVVTLRQQPREEIMQAMQDADAEMYANGIVAVGDISNAPDSRTVKLNSPVHYHTFVEVFGFNRPSAPIMAAARQLKADFAPLPASVVPHAPYSVSAALFEEIRAVTTPDDLLSIHNQETAAENELFEKGTGSFADFFNGLGIAKSGAYGRGENAIHYHLPKLSKAVNTLLVHNTFTTEADVRFATDENPNIYWCLCPNANRYIENALPDAEMFMHEKVKVTLGTDSLASNHQLSILSEMYTLQQEKDIPFEKLLEWATLNGAEFLKIEQRYGSLGRGKQPGILLLEGIEQEKLTPETRVKRLF